jgi:hypothetical protein
MATLWIACRQWAVCPAVKRLHFVRLCLWQSQVWSVFRWDLNVEHAKEDLDAACEIMFTRDASHNCMPGCEIFLAVMVSWLICVWNLFVWYQKLKFSSFVVFTDEGSFGPTPDMLSGENSNNPLTWEVMCIYPSRQWFLKLCYRTHLYSNILHSPEWKTQKLIMFWELVSSGTVRSIKW